MTRRKATRRADPGIRLHERLDQTQAKPLAAALLAARGGDIVIDASAVNHVGAQCAQVLLSARHTWQADAHAFTIAAPSSAFDESVRLLGLGAAFCD